MGLSFAAETCGLAWLLALLLFPGLAVVRSPWPFVPFLSLSFWLLSAFWLPPGTPRSAFQGAALLFFVALSALRLLKPSTARRPSASTLLALGLAVSCLAPVDRLPVAPGLGLASTEATLLQWRDGFPSTYEPLAGIPAFGAHAPGLPLLAADVARLAGLEPYRTVRLVALASAGLLAIAVSALFARAGRPRRGVLVAALVASASILIPAFIGLGPSLLAGAFGIAALGVLVKGSGRAPAVAAAFFLGAALTVDAVVGLAGLAAVAFWGEPSRRRLALVLGLALAAPRLAGLRAFSRAELDAEVRETLQVLDPRAAFGEEPGGGASPAALRAMAWLRLHSRPLDSVCVWPANGGAFVPAVALRAVLPAAVPPVYREEAEAGPRRACRFLLSFGPGDPGPPAAPPGAPLVPRWREVFAEGGVFVFEDASPGASVTSFDTLPGNREPSTP